MNEQYENIRLVIDRLKRHPLLQDVSEEDIVDYTVDFLNIMGCPELFIEKVDTLEVENYRAVLPCDFYEIIQVKPEKGSCMIEATDSFIMDTEGYKNNKRAPKNTFSNNSYKIQGNMIHFSFREGKIDLSYRAVATDGEGYPLLPGDRNFIIALELYVKYQVLTVLFDLGKISAAVLQNADQECSWAAGRCQTKAKSLSLGKAEALFNTYRTLIIRDREFSKGFKGTGYKENIRVQR